MAYLANCDSDTVTPTSTAINTGGRPIPLATDETLSVPFLAAEYQM